MVRKTLYIRFVRWTGNRIKNFCRIPALYDRLAENFLAALCLVATTCCWL
jgi:transposase